jgi:hypothetical protein
MFKFLFLFHGKDAPVLKNRIEAKHRDWKSVLPSDFTEKP